MNPVERGMYVGSGVVGAACLAGVALAGAMVFHDFQAHVIRCYSLTTSLALSEQRMLDGETYACSSQVCRLVLRFDHGHGLACYSPTRSLPGDWLSGPSSEQR
jgi:hypothetical protein